MRKKSFRTSESVTEGHPDKIADQISDAVLDAILVQDPHAHVACECFVTTGLAFVAGELNTDAHIDVQRVVRDTIQDIGYTHPELGFEADGVCVINALHEQSADIAMGVVHDSPDTMGAGDQGMMYGYASSDTPELMPLPIMLAHQLTSKLAELRKTGEIPWLRPDGKSQVTVEFDNGTPIRVSSVVLAAQHSDDVSNETIRETLNEQVAELVVSEWIDSNTKFLVNATGRFVIGGPHGDTGLTGRKIIVDTYGGVGSHGGGCFSGKDPSKVDRSASYAARFVAKNIVHKGWAKECEVQLAYAIGVPEPVAVHIDTFGTETIDISEIEAKCIEAFDFRPFCIIDRLKLRRPIFRKTAAYGHFGRELPEFLWEKRDLF